MTSRRSFIAGGMVAAVGLVVADVHGQSRKPTITVYRDPT